MNNMKKTEQDKVRMEIGKQRKQSIRYDRDTKKKTINNYRTKAERTGTGRLPTLCDCNLVTCIFSSRCSPSQESSGIVEREAF
jgi:hypothetical protein